MTESKLKDENYRKIYKEHYGIDFDENFDVHHIDFDRSNNDIDNLILLPKHLHERYHKYFNEIALITDISNLKYINIKNGCPFEYDSLASFCEVMNEIAQWKLYKTNLELKRSHNG